MKKTYKNLSALALAGVMIMGMNLTAFAAEEETNAAAAGTIEVGTNNTATLTKAMQIANKDGYVYEPTITYTYTLGNGTASGTVTDSTDLTVNYKAGDTSYLADPTAVAQEAVFSQATEITAENGRLIDRLTRFSPDDLCYNHNLSAKASGDTGNMWTFCTKFLPSVVGAYSLLLY